MEPLGGRWLREGELHLLLEGGLKGDTGDRELVDISNEL